MPEATEDATILIAKSWQALSRARNGDERTMICNCTVVIIFAGFYIESNLNHMIEKMNKKEELKQFFDKKSHPGFQDKLGWFYNRYIDTPKAINKEQLYSRGINEKLKLRFQGFDIIYKFRNNIAHGIIDKSSANLKTAENLRIQAKSIVDDLYNIASQAGFEISRSITYELAIGYELISDNPLNDLEFGFSSSSAC